MKATDIAKYLIFLMDIYGLNKEKLNDDIIECGKVKLSRLMYIAMGIALKIGIVPKTAVRDIQGNIVLKYYDFPPNEVIVSIFDEIPEAWPWGPVFKNIRRNYEQLHIEALNANYKPFHEVKQGKSLSKQRDEEIMQYILEELIVSNIAKQPIDALCEWIIQNDLAWKATCIRNKDYGFEMDTLRIKCYFDKLKKEDLFGLDIDKIYAKAQEIRTKYITKYLELQLNLDKTTNHL